MKNPTTKDPTMKRNNVIRNLSLSLLLAAGAAALPAYAQININISVAPPAPQHEVVPAIPAGYVWAPGYWGWTGERHVWVRGRTIVHREGYRWEPDRWEQRERGYFHTAGHWQRDNDYKPVKVKKQKKDKDRDDDDRNDHDNGKHRGKGKHSG